ncbi:MAG TPA: SLBB domain-containing protein [Steroidobacteraceae bacterium]|jgi:protein involved in polysaccharide export with SLBB domain
MRIRLLFAALLTIGLTTTASPQSSDTLQALKDSISPDQQSSILQNVLGGTKGDTSGKKTDKKLDNPDTVLPPGMDREMREGIHRVKKIETFDDRVLRQQDEDPELRADDTVLIDLTPIDMVGAGASPGQDNQNNPNGNNPQNGALGQNAQQALNGVAGSGTLNTSNAGSIAGVLTGNQQQNGNNNPNNAPPVNPNAYRRATGDPNAILPDPKPRTDADRDRAQKFQDTVLGGNPYKLTHQGVLEIPGMPAIPLAGLTAIEATRRLSADPAFKDFQVKLTLLRLQATGDEALKPFGYDLFKGLPTTFAPVSDIQVPVDYVVGPGDTLEVQLFGKESSLYELTVQRDGRVNFPKLGPIMVSNMSFDEARSAIEKRVSQQLIDTRVSVTMGDLRSIRVFVLGEAEKPGSYTVSGLSTMTNALFVSGGVKKIGSLRNIQLKRDGRLVTTLDLYDLLLRGDTHNDRQLLPGDVIFIPPIGKTVSVDGAVQRPAIYELKNESTAAEVINIAGGFKPDADAKAGQLERILPSRLREMHNVDLTAAAGQATQVENGDKLRVPPIRPTLENSVVLTGYVFRPGQFEYRPGLRLSDVIPTLDELRPNADQHYIMIRRVNPVDESIDVVSADLRRALGARGSPADPELKPRDKIYVFDLSADRERILAPLIRELELQATPEKPEQVVSVDGRVKSPGHYPLEPSMHVSDLIRAGGSLEDAAFRGEAEITRYDVVEGETRKTSLIPIDLAAVRRGDPGADIPLKPYDILVIKPIPMWMEPGTIELAGEVRFPGKYPIHQGETLSSVLHRAGGLTSLAFAEGSVFIREELKKREKDQIEAMAKRLQGDLAALSLEAVVSSGVSNNAAGAGAAAQSLQVGQQLLSQLRDTKPVGRLVIDLGKVIAGRSGTPDDVIVRDGDKLLVPKKTQEITILGEVQSQTSHVFEAGLSLDDYIARSGGTTQKADRKRTYVVRANGDVVSGQRAGWFRRSQNIQIRPGDTIVVPLDTERVRALPVWQSVSTIIYNLAIALLAINSVK